MPPIKQQITNSRKLKRAKKRQQIRAKRPYKQHMPFNLNKRQLQKLYRVTEKCILLTIISISNLLSI